MAFDGVQISNGAIDDLRTAAANPEITQDRFELLRTTTYAKDRRASCHQQS
jgi:hypothetical protein